MLYMVTFTINIPQMLAYIPYMDPMGMYKPTVEKPRYVNPHDFPKDRMIQRYFTTFGFCQGMIEYPWRIHGAGILMLTWLGYIDGIHVTIYTSNIPQSWYLLWYIDGTHGIYSIHNSYPMTDPCGFDGMNCCRFLSSAITLLAILTG